MIPYNAPEIPLSRTWRKSSLIVMARRALVCVLVWMRRVCRAWRVCAWCWSSSFPISETATNRNFLCLSLCRMEKHQNQTQNRHENPHFFTPTSLSHELVRQSVKKIVCNRNKQHSTQASSSVGSLCDHGDGHFYRRSGTNNSLDRTKNGSCQDRTCLRQDSISISITIVLTVVLRC